jgi:hypothetical protein
LPSPFSPRRVPRVGVLSPGKPPPDDAFRQQERFEAGLFTERLTIARLA